MQSGSVALAARKVPLSSALLCTRNVERLLTEVSLSLAIEGEEVRKKMEVSRLLRKTCKQSGVGNMFCSQVKLVY